MAAEGLASHLERVVARARKALSSLGYDDWALIGGLAVSARSEPRFTRDVDLAVAADGDREAEALVRALQRMGYRILTVLKAVSTAVSGTPWSRLSRRLLFDGFDVLSEVYVRAT